jgi:hypothetical protein
MVYGYFNFFADLRVPDSRLYIVIAVVTIFVVIGVHHVIHRFQQKITSSEDSKSSSTTQEIDDYYHRDDDIGAKATNLKTRQSRLLRKQFGIIEDDLQLYEEPLLAVSDDAKSTLIKDEGNIFVSDPTSETDGERKGLNNDENDENFDATASTKLISKHPDNSYTTKEDEDSQRRHSLTVVSPSSSPVSTLPKTDNRKKEVPKSQYERLQEYRRRQMFVAAESRLEQQRWVRSVPPLFHFWTWYDTQTSLYRQYTFVRTDGVEDYTTIVPYHPSSRRSDRISIQLRITNDLDVPISVYWVDHIGRHIPKGDILPQGGSWQQTTYVDHPWIFKRASVAPIGAADENSLSDQLTTTDNAETILLHYIPHQVIPSSKDATTSQNEMNSSADVENSIHRFHIVPSMAHESITGMYNCTVHDPLLPFPASKHLLTPRKAAEYALQHCVRMKYDKWVILQKYIQNIIDYPNDLRYRCIRLANPKFSDAVWNTPAKGVLLAYNFIEQCDIGYVYFGGNINTEDEDEDEEPANLSLETIQELQLLLHMIQLFERKAMMDYSD